MAKKLGWFCVALLILSCLHARAGDEEEEISSIIERLEEQGRLLKEEGQPARSSLDIDIYGYIKLDASYDSDRISTGNFARWAESLEGRTKDNQFNMTAKETRLGLKLFGPDYEGVVTSGVVEIDFYGGGPENMAHPMLRHAFMKIDWKEKDFSIIAGQTWDLVSPYFLPTLNYTKGWWVGDIGFLRPQIRVSQGFEVTDTTHFELQGAVARTIGLANEFLPAYSDTGADTGYPGIQYRAALSFPLIGDQDTTAGVSGHWAIVEIDTDDRQNDQNITSWSFVADLSVPLSEVFSQKAQFFWGRVLDSYLGNIGQGVGLKDGRWVGTRSKGLWYALSMTPRASNWSFNLGGSGEGMTNPQASHVEEFQATQPVQEAVRKGNWQIFGNAIYNITLNTWFGVEVSRWRTSYLDQKAGEAWRVQTSFVFKF